MLKVYQMRIEFSKRSRTFAKFTEDFYTNKRSKFIVSLFEITKFLKVSLRVPYAKNKNEIFIIRSIVMKICTHV